MKNNYAFIDGQNLHFGIKSLGWKLDHKKFRQYLSEEHDVTKAYIFLGYMEEHQDLYNVLQEAGFICFFKPLVRYDDGTIKGNVDADMVLQVMVDFEKYDQAVIISGDGDFSGMLRHLILRKKLGQVLIPNQEKYSSLFDRLEGFDSSHVTYMNNLRAKLSYKDLRRQQSSQQSRPTQNNSRSPRRVASPSAASTAAASKPSSAPKTAKKPAPATKKPAAVKRKPAKPRVSSKPKSTFKPKAELEKSLLEAIDNVS